MVNRLSIKLSIKLCVDDIPVLWPYTHMYYPIFYVNIFKEITKIKYAKSLILLRLLHYNNLILLLVELGCFLLAATFLNI